MTIALASAPTHVPSLVARLFLQTVAVARETSPPLSTFSAQPSAAHDGWLSETLERIERYRTYVDGWDGREAPGPDAGSLATSEYLTAFFADWPTSQRPKLALDMDGIPTFAAKTDEFYLHLKVEGPGLLTWFAVVDGQEYFKDDVSFDGSSLPGELASLVG